MQSVWIITWQHISPEVTVKCFFKCCESNAMNGTNDMLWNGNKEDEIVICQCDEDEGTDCAVTLIDKGTESDILCVLSVCN